MPSSPYSIPPAPHQNRSHLRQQAIAALRAGDLIAFDSACLKGWTPDLHDRHSSSSCLSPLAKDLFSLVAIQGPLLKANEQIGARSAAHLLSRFPETLWELAWSHPSYAYRDRSSGLDELWSNVASAFKAEIIPRLPIGFGEGDVGAPTLAQLQSLVLPRSFKEADEVSGAPLFGFFKSPLWQGLESKALKSEGRERETAMTVMGYLYGRIGSAHCALSQRGEVLAAERAARWMEAIGAQMEPLLNAGCDSWDQSPLITAALYSIAADQPLSLSKALLYLNTPWQGDSDTFSSGRCYSEKEARDELNKLEAITSSAPLAIEIKSETDLSRSDRLFNRVAHRALQFESAVPWRMVASKQNAFACLDYLKQQWGEMRAPSALIGKQVSFRPPAGLLSLGERSALKALAHSEASADNVRQIFHKQAHQSALFISRSSLPQRLKELLLADNPSSLELAGDTTERNGAQDKKELMAIRRALSGKPFVFHQQLPFGWAAAALCLRCDPLTLTRSLREGELSVAAEQAKSFIESIQWSAKSLSVIEQDALSRLSNANAAPLLRKSRL